MKRKLMKVKKNNMAVYDDKKVFSGAIDTLNDVIMKPLYDNNADIKNDSWVNILTKCTSGIALGTADAGVYENIAYKKDPMLANYFSQYSRSVNSANRSLTTMIIENKIQLLLLDKFYTLVGQLENEFEWMKPSLKEKIKILADDLLCGITIKIANIHIESIYYVAYMNCSKKDNDSADEIYNNIEKVLNPIIVSLVSEIMAYLTTKLYDTFYAELVTEITSDDFNIICDYMRPYLIDFKDDMMCVVYDILFSLLIYRVNTTYLIYNQAKNFAEEMDVPFYY